MQTSKTPKTHRTGRPLAALTTWLLLVALLVQSLSVGCLAAVSDISSLLSGSSGSAGSNLTGQSSGIGHFQSDEVIAKLKKDFLQHLDLGKHTITVKFTDGEAEGSFKISAPADESNPKTGDTIGIWFRVLLLSFTGILGTALVYRKKFRK